MTGFLSTRQKAGVRWYETGSYRGNHIFNKDNEIVGFQIEDVFVSQDGSAGGIALEDGNIGYLDDNFEF